MDTSKTIKMGQYKPAEIRPYEKDWNVLSSDKTRWYRVTRTKSGAFWCECQAHSLCRHISAVVVREMKRTGYKLVQIWTSEEDAKRQNRKMFVLTRNGKQFWVTASKIGAFLPGVVRFSSRWGARPGVDLYYRNSDGTDRRETREDWDWQALAKEAEKLGWTERGLYWHRENPTVKREQTLPVQYGRGRSKMFK